MLFSLQAGVHIVEERDKVTMPEREIVVAGCHVLPHEFALSFTRL